MHADVEMPIQHVLASLVEERAAEWSATGVGVAPPVGDDLAALAFFLRTLEPDDPNVVALAALVPGRVERPFPSAETLRLVRGFAGVEPGGADALMRLVVAAEVAAALAAERRLLAA